MVPLSIAAALTALAFSQPPVAPAGLPNAQLVRLTGGSPLPRACETRGVQRGAEVEPSIASAPGVPGLLIALWQQDRYVGGGAAAIGAAVSHDGGASWRRTSVPRITDCTGRGNTATDPWVSIGADGTAYVLGLVGRPNAVGFRTRIAISRSRNSGDSWSRPALLDAGGNGFNDKPSLTADPLRPGRAYAVWTLESWPYLSRTTNGGANWSPPRALRPRARAGGTVSSTISVLRNGSLLHVFLAYGSAGARIEAARSTDQGAHWSKPRRVALLRPRGGSPPSPVVRTLPLSGTGPAVAPSGVVYEAFTRRPEGGSVDVVRSTDGGRSWSKPRAAVRHVRGVFAPAIAAAPEGTLALSYYAREPDGKASFWIARSINNGSTWQRRRVAAPFSLRRAPRSDRGAFLGDYTGLTPTGGGFAAAFAASPPLASNGRSDVFVALAGG
jgi:BNR repeat protein